MSVLSFQELQKKDFFYFNKILKCEYKYLVHLPRESSSEPESLLTHSDLVLKYTIKLIEDNKLEKNFNHILTTIGGKIKIQNDIKLFYLKAIYWHDIGKINENFQKDKMKNSFENIENGISSKHSILSTYLYLYSCFDYIMKNYQDKNERTQLISICSYFSLTIWRHHTGLLKSIKELINDEDEGLPTCNLLTVYVEKLDVNFNNVHDVIMKNLRNIPFGQNEQYLFLSKSLFSLLIISDYYATAQFMNYGNIQELKYDNFGLIDDEFRDKIYGEFYTDKFNKYSKPVTFNQVLKNQINSSFKKFEELQEKSNENLNHLRSKLFVEVRTTLLSNLDKSLFYIEAPTGAGKTNLSVMSAVEILQKDKSINKIFYVFPFTTLITQTYESVTKVLNLNNNEIVQLHSKAPYNQKELKQDGVYGDIKTNFLDNQFMNYPVTLLSHVKFFDVLTGISKDDNYIFHRLANSIVIIDEIQTYNPNLWSNIVYLLDTMSKNFNIKFIVMSATLPKIGEILSEVEDPFVKLVGNKHQYFKNPNFAGRVTIDQSTIKIKKEKDIYKKLLEESKNYQKLESNKLAKVKTIIEFITKKGADKFYKYAKEQKVKDKLFDKIFILSGTIIEPRRKEIINILKNTNDKNILLVTTQVVEAGVDIDMDIGFKERSLIDSDEQLAGRINRNSSKEGCKLFLFELEQSNAKAVCKKDKWLGISTEENVLETKDFDKYYKQVIAKLKTSNSANFIDNLNTYKDHIKNLRFDEAHIKIIDMDSISVFVPITTMAKLYWNAYEKAIKNEEKDLIDKKINIKRLSAKISKYTFSLADYKGSGIKYLKDYGDEKYGYLYLADWDNKPNGKQLYTYEDGLDTSVLSGDFAPMIF